MTDQLNRRQLKTRSRALPARLAAGLARAGITPNQVSVLGVLFALIAGWCFAAAYGRSGWEAAGVLFAAAACIQLRLLCNLLDGMLAIEGGLKSPAGELYNEIPDRIADIVILVGAGYALREHPWGVTLGWTAALLAVLTAYVRLLGGSLRLKQDFGGPMAKQHRMFTLTLGALLAAVEVMLRGTTWAVAIALFVIVIGAAITFARRTVAIARALGA